MSESADKPEPEYPMICVRCGGDRKRTVTLRVGPLIHHSFEQGFDLCGPCIRTLLDCVARFIGVGSFPEIEPPEIELISPETPDE